MIRMFINLAHDAAFWRSVRLAALILLCAYARDGIMARASDDDMRLRVERALVDAGYAQAAGYSQLPPAPVEEVDELPNNNWGAYSVATGRISISRQQPEGCKRLTLAHEVAHDITARMKLHLAVPPDRVMAFFERVSLIAEEAADADQFSPNCFKARGTL
jgi:hypothetical protein